MRVAVTIIYNGLHHLLNRGFAKRMAEMFDVWVVVDGLSDNFGSGGNNKLNLPAISLDGTIEYLNSLIPKYPNIKILQRETPWKSKDEQFNYALTYLRGVYEIDNTYLWQVDADEQWELADIVQAEIDLNNEGANCGACGFVHLMGIDLVAIGEWSSFSWARLWKWNGQELQTHEPPIMQGGNGKTILLKQKFIHYSYYFEFDVRFKATYYKGYQRILQEWQKLVNGRIRVPIRAHLVLRLGNNKMIRPISRTNILQYENQKNQILQRQERLPANQVVGVDAD